MKWVRKERLITCPAVLVVSFVCVVAPALRAHEGAITVVSGASFTAEQPLAPNSIAVVFGGGFAEQTTVAGQGELPEELDSVSVVIEDSAQVEHRAKIFAVAKARINILIPDLPDGTAHMQVLSGGASLADGEFEIRSVSPGLFSAANTGSGLAAAIAVRVNADGTQSFEPVAVFHTEREMWEPIPLNTAAGPIYLSLFGTGIRNGSDLTAAIDGVPIDVRSYGAHPVFPGLDQVDIGPLPPELSGRSVVDLVLTVDGIEANSVQFGFSGGAGEAVTFNNQIIRLFQAHCQVCHHPGEVAPFSLMDYESAKPRAHGIKWAAAARYMPPWKPVPGYGEFIGERRLDEAEIDLIARWVDAGVPEGDPADLPEPLVFNEEWTLGDPDLVLEVPEYTPDPNVEDDYRCFSVPVPTDTVKSITKVEVRPGNRGIVHHLILFGDPTGRSAALEAAAGGAAPGYECFGDPGFAFDGIEGVESYIQGGWVPGYRPQVLPEGSGYYLRAGARIAVQIHYHADGTQQSDRTRIGLHFSEEPTEDNVLVLPVLNREFEIPPGAENYEVTAELALENPRYLLLDTVLRSLGKRLFPVEVISVLPHMHLLGREIRMDKISAAGEETPMIYIDDWDFHWQDMYTYVEPVLLESTDVLKVRAWYDNSASNPRNPHDPPRAVGWGNGTNDEMCIVFFLVKIPDLCGLPLGLCGGM